MDNLKGKTIKGVKWTTLSAIIGATSQLLLMIILAHYVGKKDFGIMALALFIINFSQLFTDLGISNALIHKQDVNNRQLSSLYWLNVFLGIIFFALVFSTAPLIAQFYEEELLCNVIRCIGITFLIQPFGIQFSILLRKDLRFKEIAIRSIVARVAAFVVGLVLGYMDYGVWALVISNIIMAVVDTAMLLIIGLRLHKPSLHFSHTDIKPFLSFGMFQMGEKSLNYINSNVDGIIIGKVLGIEVLGVYNVAKDFVLKPFQVVNPILTKVAFPVMAKFQFDIRKLKTSYLNMQKALAYINFPIFICIIFYTDSIVDLIFGAKWIDAVEPLKVLAAYSLIRSTMNPIGTLQLARGKAEQGFYWNLLQFFLIPVVVYIGGYWGIMGVCYTLLMMQSLMFIAGWWFMVRRLCEASLPEYLNVFLKPLILGTVPALVTLELADIYLVQINIVNTVFILATYCLLLLVMQLVFNKTYISDFRKFS